MIDYISGKVAVLTPTRVVIENNGIGYSTEISLQTYAELEGKDSATIYIQQQTNPRDGSFVDYGFAGQAERELFRKIISVSGMGAATARMILSTFNPDEFAEALLAEDIKRIQSVKGLGAKSAQRLVLELKDKIVQGDGGVSSALFAAETNKAVDEAATALQLLGFAKPNVSRALQSILKINPTAKVEDLIKAALQIL